TRFSRDWSSDVCSSDLQLGTPRTFTSAGQINSKGTETTLRQHSAQADIESARTNPVHKSGTQEHKHRQFFVVLLRPIGQGQNPEQPRVIAKLQNFFCHDFVRHANRHSRTGCGFIRFSPLLSQLHGYGSTSAATSAGEKPFSDAVLTTCSLLLGTRAHASAPSEQNCSRIGSDMRQPPISRIASLRSARLNLKLCLKFSACTSQIDCRYE